ncbi:MAG: P1 family peptidase, partial [Pikeienuella sp.]
NGGEKAWQTNPYRALGVTALANAATDFAIGSVGAGTGATAADVKGGLGSASLVLPSGATVGALVAANPVGTLATPDGNHLWAGAYEVGNEFGGHGPDPTCYQTSQLFASKVAAPRENTTIAIVATDAALTKAEAHRMAIAAHDGIARATVPAHTPFDGDLVFAAATGAHDGPVNLTHIGHAAALCLSRAIGRAAFAATPAPNDTKPCWAP